MSILFATTTVSLLSPTADDLPDSDDDWGGSPDPETGYSIVASGIRAHLSAPSGNALYASEGSSVTVTYRLLCDPSPVKENMQVRDDTTGITYQVAWCLPRPEPLAHVVAGLTRSEATS